MNQQFIYMPKRACPRDRGYFQCAGCREATLEQAVMSEYPVDPLYCGQDVDGKVCGKTHLGYTWCETCQQDGHQARNEPCMHAGQFEVVATISELSD